MLQAKEVTSDRVMVIADDGRSAGTGASTRDDWLGRLLGARSDLGPARISVAVDGDAKSWGALAEAALIARTLGAGLKIVSILDPAATGPGPLTGPAVTDLDRTRVRYTARVLEDAANRVPRGVPVEIDGLVGDPAMKLEQISGECDLLVVGSRNPGSSRRVRLGGVCAHLAKRARCPVLITSGAARDPISSRRYLVGGGDRGGGGKHGDLIAITTEPKERATWMS